MALGKPHGYPMFKGKRAHVWLYELLIGPVPDGQVLHHSCENKVCVNPWHQEPMTQDAHNKFHKTGKKMNLTDGEVARRAREGRRLIHHASNKAYTKRTRSEVSRENWDRRGRKLTDEVCAEIVKAKASGKKVYEIVEAFGISYTSVFNALRRVGEAGT